MVAKLFWSFHCENRTTRERCGSTRVPAGAPPTTNLACHNASSRSKAEPHIDAEPVGELTLKVFHRPASSHNVLAIREETSN
jgi:hypothetical protein